ncbi:MAG TPA: deoxyribodipyrimidine photo-lyase [Solirubrobacteraceae bacterium]|nr:deoxyribodipyrimidine photo-lyase [Solirubrobacteraceae bacterium]
MSGTSILWLRRDLRIHDHPALEAARSRADHLVPVFCFDDRLLHGRHASGPRTQFLLECLADLDLSLRARGSRLVVRHGRPEHEIPKLIAETKADAVHFTADAGPFARTRDTHVTNALNVPSHEHPGLFAIDDLEAIRTHAGEPYTVFTPFHRTWLRTPRRRSHGAPRRLPLLPERLDPGTLPGLTNLGLRQEVEEPMPGGESHARERLTRFIADRAQAYGDTRDLVAEDGASRLSPYLHFGCLSPRELEDRVPSAEFRRQLCWRDFYAHVLRHFPRNAHSEHQERYRGTIRWSRSNKRFEAWREGRTGYPLVDAGMRQLQREGWMHNRARLVAASFLTKDLGIDWRWGERWFMRLLLDGDEASNNGNWQWIASVGVDPQPAFRRMFNPERQRERFDPDCAYVERYVPELRKNGEYIKPIVEHKAAREEALARYRLAASPRRAAQPRPG